MNQHYILSINPQADYEWERCVLRNPITGEHPDLLKAIAESIGKQPGSHLIKVSINVEILETVPYLPESTVNSSVHSVSKLPTATNLLEKLDKSQKASSNR
ncbi:MAG: hypothetical protein QNJ70_02285 [Xenococcaceae cyanobacterium MO_207.B15]|nr:hypothetical protein [Xenococcaceae cyanobacterium MO_207.B15]